MTRRLSILDNDPVERIPLKDNGLVGALFLPEKQGPQPLVITLGGFRGGVNELRAEKLASQGIAALSLAYFGCPGLPATLQEIPLEYCEKALDWVASHPRVLKSRIALWGVSRGAELALLLASLMPERFAAIVATVPTSAVYGSIQSDAPAWLYSGKRLAPNAPFSMIPFDPKLGTRPEWPLPLTPFFLEGMKEVAAFNASKIQVEKFQCPLLLVSGEDDKMWPSTIYCEQILERIKEKGTAISFVHYSYPNAGHSISASEEIVEFHPIAKIWFAFGGKQRDNAMAKVDSWEKTVEFFRSWIF